MSNATDDTERPTAPAINGGTKNEAAAQPELSAELRKASEATLQPRLIPIGTGKRGPDKQPRRPRAVPVAKMAGRAPGPLLETASKTSPLPVEFDAGPPADEVALEKMVAAIVSAVSKNIGTLFYLLGKAWTGDEQVAETARKAVELDKDEQAGLTSGGAYVWQKYLGTITDPRELAFWICLGGFGVKVSGAFLHLKKARHDLQARTPEVLPSPQSN